jgi:hypothetical protein
MYENARYIKGFEGNVACINANLPDGQLISVPINLENTDYQNLMALVAAGKLTIAPAEGG